MLAPRVALTLALLSGCTTDVDPDETAVAIAESQPRPVVPGKELVITDPSVIRAPLETTFDPSRPSGTAPAGAWSFGRLVHNMLPAHERDSAAAASRLVLAWLRTWETDQTPNPEVSPAFARPAIRTLITNPWKAASGCADPASPATDATCVLDLRRAPFRLAAIVNRPDLRIVADDGTAIGGEGRFVFQVVGPTLGVDATTGAVTVMDPVVRPQKFTVIFEYSLPVATNLETLKWANRWHSLGALPFGPGFNAMLRTITTDFSGPDRDRRRPNGNALNQLRTNEVALMGARFPTAGFVTAKQFWELREFALTATGLQPHTVNLEPARDFDVARPNQLEGEGSRTDELISFLGSNAAAVAAGRFTLPAGMSGNSALVGSAPYGAWGKLLNPSPPTRPATGFVHDLTGVDIAVRDSFALSTCAGCHRHETDTRHFMHVTLVGAMEPADKVDDRARVGVGPTTSDDATVLSNLLAADIAPGGGRHDDYARLLVTTGAELQNRRGPRRSH
ncbi:MAG: hypothetical protein M3680_05950 [Myxococcota bacterium]|nr:hypothetical protein [Myxococcota bacterium]